MIEWTVEEKVLLNSRQVVVDGWRMNDQQLNTCLEKLLKNQDRVMPGRLGKGFLEIISQIAAGKMKARWSDLMKDIEKLQELIQEHWQWEEENWFEYLQELEVQQDRFFKTQLGAAFIETLKYKLNLLEEPEKKKKQIEDDQEILPPFLRETEPPAIQQEEEPLPWDSSNTGLSRKGYFRKKAAKSKKQHGKKKNEPETAVLDEIKNQEAAEIMTWDPFASDLDTQKDSQYQNDWDPFEDLAQLDKQDDGAFPDQWVLQEEKQETADWDLFADEPVTGGQIRVDPFEEPMEQEAQMDGNGLDETSGGLEPDGWGALQENIDRFEETDWNALEDAYVTGAQVDWDSLEEKMEENNTEQSCSDTETAAVSDIGSDTAKAEMETENEPERTMRKQKPAEKKRLSMSKVLERTAIAVIACLSLCLIVFWLRDQIARNMDKWNMKQIKIGSFGIAGESLEEWQLSEINGLQYKQGTIQKRGNYDV